MDGEEKKVLTLYNTWSTESKCVGYCYKHKAYVTVPQVKEKECVKKGCNAFRRKDHLYWKRKERFKKLRKQKKELGIPTWEKVEIRTDHEGELIKCRRVKN